MTNTESTLIALGLLEALCPTEALVAELLALGLLEAL